MNTDIISVAIVDDHTLFRNGIASLLNEFQEIEISFDAPNGLELQKLIAHQVPDIILMDINMPVMEGYQTTQWLKDNYPQVCVLALSMFDDDAAIIKMIRAGAKGYISKESTPVELLHAIKTLKAKGVFINELVSGKMLKSFQIDEQVSITAKEKIFLELCCSELTYKEIAGKMFISPRTVDNYRESLFDKLNIKSRVGLVLYAVKHKMVNIQ